MINSSSRISCYDDFAEKYMNSQDEFYAKVLDVSRKEIYHQINFSLKDKKVLDVGCGVGEDLPYFKKQGALVYGIDVSKKMIELAKKNNPSIKNFSVQSFENTTFEDRFFDVIVSRYALHYAENIEEVFIELHRILKPGGFLIFLVTHPLLSFITKKERNYYTKEIIEIPLFNNKVIVKEPAHTFAEYFNKFLLENFELLSFSEGPKEGISKETNFKEIVPDFFILKLKKK